MSDYSSAYEEGHIPDDTVKTVYMRPGVTAALILSKRFIEKDRQRINDVFILDDGTGLNHYLSEVEMDIPKPIKFVASSLSPKCISLVFKSALSFNRLYYILRLFNMVLRPRGVSQDAFLLSNQHIPHENMVNVVDVGVANAPQDNAMLQINSVNKFDGILMTESVFLDNTKKINMEEEKENREFDLSSISFQKRRSKSGKRSDVEIFLDEMKSGGLTRKEVAKMWLEKGKTIEATERAAMSDTAKSFETTTFNTKAILRRNALVDGVSFL